MMKEELEQQQIKGIESVIQAYENIISMISKDSSFGTEKDLKNYIDNLIDLYTKYINHVIEEDSIQNHENAISYCEKAIELDKNRQDRFFENSKEKLLNRMLKVFTHSDDIDFFKDFYEINDIEVIIDRLIRLNPQKQYYHIVKGDIYKFKIDEFIEKYLGHSNGYNYRSVAGSGYIEIDEKFSMSRIPKKMIEMALDSYNTAISIDSCDFTANKKKLTFLVNLGMHQEALEQCIVTLRLCKKFKELTINNHDTNCDLTNELNKLSTLERHLLYKISDFYSKNLPLE
ncbi:hypothetical protein FTV88_1957 [Heliorestis convoluta]|uniref:Uncharacterized protein n=2 Tax=Heliorestis convoluta TaxID=356322 RepID=A0A5Q2N662_9FIRM|nr:hypothetical protein FTV88_1957 [Heliorestis convoluta]